jgi:hypothetical protein
MQLHKTCLHCNEDKPLDAFHVNSKGRLGRQAKCKPCTRALYYEPIKESLIEASRRRRALPGRKALEAKWQRDRRRGQPIVRMLQEARVRARKRGFEFSITADDLRWPSVCPVLGIAISMAAGPRADCSPSIDRINTARGYAPGNVAIISWRANRLKNDATLAELQAIVGYIEALLGVGMHGTMFHEKPAQQTVELDGVF